MHMNNECRKASSQQNQNTDLMKWKRDREKDDIPIDINVEFRNDFDYRLLNGAHMKGYTMVVFKENLNQKTNRKKTINQWLVKTVRCPYRANNGIGYLSANVTSIYVISTTIFAGDSFFVVVVVMVALCHSIWLYVPLCLLWNTFQPIYWF